jgi:hypothetical protein
MIQELPPLLSAWFNEKTALLFAPLRYDGAVNTRNDPWALKPDTFSPGTQISRSISSSCPQRATILGGGRSLPLESMRSAMTVRPLLALTALAAFVAGTGGARLCAQKGHSAPPPPHVQAPHPPPQSQISGIQRRTNPGVAAPKGEHLAEWMNQHSNLTPAQQQQALEREPGFHDLPNDVQQRYRDRLTQLNAMSPDQRQRLLARNEALEHMTPNQRSDFRGVMQQLGSLPEDQRRAVARTFRQLRELPPDQRAGALNADPRYRTQFNDAQRATINNLLRIEPLLPPQ